MGRSSLWILLGACSPPAASDVVIARVDPGSATSTASVPVRIEGTGFHLPVTSDLDDGSTVVGALSVTVGGAALEGAVWRGEALIEGSVPMGLPVGPHDVIVTLGDRAGILVDGYVVLGDQPPLTCPAGYDLALAGSPSRYRVIATAADFETHHDSCNADAPGTTHLASPETATEIEDLRSALVMLGTPAGNYYIGAVQQPGQAAETEGWFVFTGGALPAGQWGGTNPNDDEPGENNQENLAALNTGDLLHDVTGDLAYPAICECDGMPIDPTVAGYIPDD